MVSPVPGVTSIEGTTLTIFLLSFLSLAINPGCKCIRFTSTFGKEWGIFRSPDYPESYPADIRCLLYSFQAPRHHIVQVVLEDFNLPETKSVGCLSGDYLKFFLHLEEDGVNELTPWNSLLCGRYRNQSSFSSSRHLIIQFHSSPGKSQRKSAWRFGFLGRFRFIDASQFESSGRLVPGTKCNYRFQGGNSSSAASGRFFSPNYPSVYPHNIKCSYYFHASLHERVKLIFESVELQPGDFSCLNKTDVIRVLDGSSPTSSVISLICNDLKGFEVLSTGPDLVVEFMANSEYPQTGFKGRFHFVKIQFDNAEEGSEKRLEPFDSVHSRGKDGLTQASTLIPQCNQVVTSDGGRNGTFTSPNYPHQYPPKTHCRFDFIGHGRERVQILFTDFSLFHPERNPKSCEGEDTLRAMVSLEGNLARLEDFCGINTPLSLMSNGHRLTLELNAPKSSRGSRGFSAMYFFVEDFGIKVGRQLRDFPCAFVFNSSGSPNGTFSSPNHPGPYPRDTECHYFFYGQDKEHVDIHFQHFSLKGSPPCDKTTESDYLEFSNHMPVDSGFSTTCGDLEPFRIQSDGKFFG